MSDLKLGSIIETEQFRDAIHVAVAPVIADQTLIPGEHIGLTEGTTDHARKTKDPIGIVDPYLREPVLRNQRFWMFLYPQTVTGMRHEWKHPAFSTAPVERLADKAASEKWLREYAIIKNSYDGPEQAFQRLINGIKDGEIYFHGSDLHGLHELDDADALREHAETYLGIKISWDSFTFSCSC